MHSDSSPCKFRASARAVSKQKKRQWVFQISKSHPNACIEAAKMVVSNWKYNETQQTQRGCHQCGAMDDMDIIMIGGGGAPLGGETT